MIDTEKTNTLLREAEYANSRKKWRVNGKFHREDGPAVIRANGNKEWWVNGKRHREDGPAIERANGTKEWWLNGKRHREDGSAIERANGTKEWYLNNNLHREDGPAVIRANGTKEWWLNGKNLPKKKSPNINLECYLRRKLIFSVDKAYPNCYLNGIARRH
jgi:hypothetical protein